MAFCPPDQEGHSPAGTCYLCALPSELIDTILCYLSPVDITAVSATCHALYKHATSEHLWQALVQANVPGVKLTSPSPCRTFRALFAAHDPRWFLTKYKIWFSNRDLTSKLVVIRYDPRRGCIEGYQLLATSNRTTFEHWQHDNQVIIHGFEPSVKLHLDRPVLQLHVHNPENLIHQNRGPAITRIPLREASSSSPSSSTPSSATANATTTQADPPPTTTATTSPWRSRLQGETPMMLDDESGAGNGIFSNFMLARPLSPDEADTRAALPFPYGDVWPPPAVPSRHRVIGAMLRQAHPLPQSGAEYTPTRRSEVSDLAFRIRNWLEMRGGRRGAEEVGGAGGAEAEPPWARLLQVLLQPQHMSNISATTPLGVHIGEEIATYATLDPELYTPTAEKPYRGIWVGDYSGHGCEFLLIHQPDGPDDGFDPDSIVRLEGETDDEFRRRRRDETVHRGRLEAIKLTGDPNVPRGEYTFVAEDLGEGGFVTVVQEPPFAGARVVRSKGHVAHTGFLDGESIPLPLLSLTFLGIALLKVRYRQVHRVPAHPHLQ